MTTRSKNLVIGLGSWLSRDDAFGLLVLDRLASVKPAPMPLTDLLSAGTDLIRSIDLFPEYSLVILVDTVLDPGGKIGSPGDVIILDERTFLAWPEASPSVHEFSPLVAVRLFRKLYPEARTCITLVAHCADRVSLQRPGAEALDDKIVEAGVRLVLSLL